MLADADGAASLQHTQGGNMLLPPAQLAQLPSNCAFIHLYRAARAMYHVCCAPFACTDDLLYRKT